MGMVFTVLIAGVIGFLLIKNVKSTIKNTKAGSCSGCPSDCPSGSCSVKEKVQLDDF